LKARDNHLTWVELQLEIAKFATINTEDAASTRTILRDIVPEFLQPENAVDPTEPIQQERRIAD
jgi:hypothetical protein